MMHRGDVMHSCKHACYAALHNRVLRGLMIQEKRESAAGVVKIWTHVDKPEHEWMTEVIRTDCLSPQKELVGRRHDVMHKNNILVYMPIMLSCIIDS